MTAQILRMCDYERKSRGRALIETCEDRLQGYMSKLVADPAVNEALHRRPSLLDHARQGAPVMRNEPIVDDEPRGA